MPGKRRNVYAPESLLGLAERIMKENKFNSKVEAMEEIAREYDKVVIKKKRKL